MYNMTMNEEIAIIKNWLGLGSINVFGLPYSGKDTVGIRLAEAINGRYLSSGLILREAKENQAVSDSLKAGLWVPTDQFYDLVLPFFHREDLKDLPLILGGIGRWSGEEPAVMDAASSSGHEIKAVILLNMSEADVHLRWEQGKILQDRGERSDDQNEKSLDTRINEFRTKTMPVIQTYRNLGLLIPIRADMSKDEVFTEVLQKLAAFAASNS